MSTRISTNIDSLRGLLALQQSSAQQSQALERLSTGTQINSAADNPSGLIQSNALGLQISAINQSITNSNLANNVLGTADAALSQVDTLLTQIRGLVQQGVSTGGQSQSQIQADQSQIDSALSAINQISSNTNFGGQNLLDGSLAYQTKVSPADAGKLSNVSINQAVLGSASNVVVSAKVVTAATQGQLTYNGGNLTSATTLQVSGAQGSQVLFFGAGSSYQNIADAVNANTAATGVSASITTAAVSSTLTQASSNFTNSIEGSSTDAGVSFDAVNSSVTVKYVASGANTTRSVSVSGNAVTVNLATDANGNIASTETASSIATSINNSATASPLVKATAEGNGTGVVEVAGSTGTGTTFGGSISGTDANGTENFTAANSNVTLRFVVSGNNTAQSISVSGNAVTVNLATDANGNVTAAETATAIATAVNGNAAAHALVTLTAGGTGATVLAANGATGVNSVTDAVSTASTNGNIQFADARQDAGASDTPVTVNFVTAGNNTARSISVNGTAITVNLATDANGSVLQSESATSIVAALAANSQTNALVTATAVGTGAGRVASSGGAQTLTGGVNGTLTLTSSDYGSQQFVGITALNGTFGTYDSTNTVSSRNAGTDIVAQINGQTAQGNGLTATTSSSLLNAAVTFSTSANASNVTSNVTITGGGALFQIGQNVSAAGQVGIGINAANTATLGGAAGKLFELGSGGGKSLLNVGQNGVTGSDLVDIVNQALAAVDNQRATIGSIQSNNIQTNINSLGVALSNISGAKSQISDTDFAATTAQLTQSQVLTQAGISVLQIANQEPQQVLKLLG
ncbi:MAG TPA: flagellin [Planctomycetaceae bacterium]|jgi:flagellin